MRWWSTKRRREQKQMAENGLEEARSARQAAEQRLVVTTSEVTIPLRDMHRENHIQPLIDVLITRRARRESK